MRSAFENLLCGAVFAGLAIAGTLSAKAGPGPVPKEQVVAYERGKAEAERAIASKKPVMETFGLRLPPPDDFADILAEKYGVKLTVVAGCVVNAEILGHARGVNEVTETWLKNKYGRDVLDKVRAEAQRRRESRRPKPEPDAPKSPEPKSV